jgi:hypothetical protein
MPLPSSIRSNNYENQADIFAGGFNGRCCGIQVAAKESASQNP